MCPLEVTDHEVNVTIRVSPGAIRNYSGDKNMKIAQIAPLMESVPPRLYGGTERVSPISPMNWSRWVTT